MRWLMKDIASAEKSKWWRLGWFIALWFAGVGATLLLALPFRLMVWAAQALR
jgi:hypothetical protein